MLKHVNLVEKFCLLFILRFEVLVFARLFDIAHRVHLEADIFDQVFDNRLRMDLQNEGTQSCVEMPDL